MANKKMKEKSKNENVRILTPADVAGIDLMTKEQYVKVRDIIPTVETSWWLRDPGTGMNMRNSYSVSFVGGINESEPFCIDELGMNADFKCGVRPILYLQEGVGLTVGQKVEVFQRVWTAIDTHTIFSDTVIGKTVFREKKYNNPHRYETSDVKHWLENWLASAGDDGHSEYREPSFKGVFDTCNSMIHPEDDSQLLIDDIIIEDISLLSEKQYITFQNKIKPLKQEWIWLSTEEADDPRCALVIDYDDVVYRGDVVVSHGSAVRPILVVIIKDEEKVNWGTENRNGETVQTLKLFGLPWTRLDETILLCDTWIAHKPYYEKYDPIRKNSFDQSDLRRDFLYPWLIERYLLRFIDKADVSLLSTEEYMKATNEGSIPIFFRDLWWRLRSKGLQNGYVVAARKRFLLYLGARSDYYEDVRPAIHVKDKCIRIPIRGKVRLFGFEFTAIDDHLLLCDQNIGPENEQMRFHKNYSELTGDSDWFEKSDIKRFIQDEWFDDNLRKMDEVDRKRIEETEGKGLLEDTHQNFDRNGERIDRRNDEEAGVDWGNERVEIANGIFYYRQLRRIARNNPHDEEHTFVLNEVDTQIIESLVNAGGAPLRGVHIPHPEGYNIPRRILAIRRELIAKGLENVRIVMVNGMEERRYCLLRNDRRGYYFPFDGKN